MTATTRTGRTAVLLVCFAAAGAYLAIGLARDAYVLAFGGAAIMVGYAGFLALFAGRSEAVALLAGDHGDERRQQLTLRAYAATGQVLVVALVAGALWSLAAGSHLAGVFCGLCALGGVSFAAALVWCSRRG